jgi:ATP-dependent exoDNAse (exonuclease V) beta subunit
MTATEFTPEQLGAIERRDGDLLLDASAGSGKTSVLVERFVRAVLEDEIDVSAILAITFTDKAAAELRERIRMRLRELGAVEQARATEGAFISTIHGFCAKVLRAQALAAGIDPRFVVLDELEARRLAGQAFDEALAELDDVELIASYGTGPLRGAAVGTYAELRSRGEREPALPPLPPAPEDPRGELAQAAAALAGELGAIPSPSTKVREALTRLERVGAVSGAAEPWPGDLDRLKLPGGNGAALSTPMCEAYEQALERVRHWSEHLWAQRTYASLDRLLSLFGARYAAHKRAASGVDFEDLGLLVRDLFAGNEELRERYASRFEQVMVDEFQDTNKVQLDLINRIAGGNLFVVGDGQQSIYGFRHADVELFERLGERLEAEGRRATLQTSFRSRPEIVEVINRAFADDRFRPLLAGRTDPPASEPLVELLVVDKGEEWATTDGVASPWRAAEARALARRVRELIDGGAAPADVVVLTRATTDLRAYERALEEQAIPTYLIGGRGYWSHPQVMDLVAYLRALANPLDEEAYYQLLASPLVGLSIDALVLVAAAMRAGEHPDGLGAEDEQRLQAFTNWFAAERRLVGRLGLEELIERAIVRGGYDLHTLALPGGERRLANLRKLMRLGREYEQRFGRDLRGFLDLVGARAAGLRVDARESEAPVEGEALDAVRLMTIHRAKGLEFKIVVVADLGREPWRFAPLLRVGADGRIGLRLARPGTRKPVPVLSYAALADAQQKAEAAEERRIFYVAMTRAQERLILTGAAKLDENGGLALRPPNGPSSPINWIARALAEAGVEPEIVSSEEPPGERERAMPRGPAPAPDVDEPGSPEAPPRPTLSYSALAAYERCGYRFYLERVLGLPAVTGRVVGAGALERGILVHELLEQLDFRRPRVPEGASDDVAELLRGFIQTPLFERLAAAGDTRREEGFAFVLESGALITGALDVVARERDGRMLVVDYKTDRVEGADPAAVVERDYRTQRVIYALAALRAGATEVEVAHVFLERPTEPVTATFSDRAALEHELEALAGGVLGGAFPVSADPCVALCNGCPAEGGLCSWPLEMTRREAPDVVAPVEAPGAVAPVETPAPAADGETASDAAHTAPEPDASEPREPEALAPATGEAQGRLF